jgi:hypothetical protein
VAVAKAERWQITDAAAMAAFVEAVLLRGEQVDETPEVRERLTARPNTTALALKGRR